MDDDQIFSEKYIFPILQIVFGIIVFIFASWVIAEIIDGLSTPPTYTSEITGEYITDCNDIFPRNPYNKGTGHYAGFEWASEKTPIRCGGNSGSFIEGCQAFLDQQEDYDNCEGSL